MFLLQLLRLCGCRTFAKENVVCVLNHCPVAIRLRRYNVLHFKILHELSLFVRAHLAPSASNVLDIGEGYAFPIHI